jgi:hypothetical protein
MSASLDFSTESGKPAAVKHRTIHRFNASIRIHTLAVTQRLPG